MEGKIFSTKVIWYYEQLTIFFFNGALPLGCAQAVILIVMKVICKLFGQNNNNKNKNIKSDIMYTRTLRVSTCGNIC